MKKKKLLSLLSISIGLCISLGLIVVYLLFNRPCPPPEKPNNVPIGAIWVGGCDGGNWIELISVKNNSFRYRIYRDWNGVLMLDADFEHLDCNTISLTESNWKSYINYFLNDPLELSLQLKGDSCRLQATKIYYTEE